MGSFPVDVSLLQTYLDAYVWMYLRPSCLGENRGIVSLEIVLINIKVQQSPKGSERAKATHDQTIEGERKRGSHHRDEPTVANIY